MTVIRDKSAWRYRCVVTMPDGSRIRISGKQSAHKFGGSKPRNGVVATELAAFRATPTEQRRYQRAADAAGVTMSKWLRGLADKASNTKGGRK